jgi:hypothetical protein
MAFGLAADGAVAAEEDAVVVVCALAVAAELAAVEYLDRVAATAVVMAARQRARRRFQGPHFPRTLAGVQLAVPASAAGKSPTLAHRTAPCQPLARGLALVSAVGPAALIFRRCPQLDQVLARHRGRSPEHCPLLARGQPRATCTTLSICPAWRISTLVRPPFVLPIPAPR